jgi:hypothetical protein
MKSLYQIKPLDINNDYFNGINQCQFLKNKIISFYIKIKFEKN